MWGWGSKRAERARLRELERAQDCAYAAWSAAINAYNNAVKRGDTRDINRTHQAMREAMNERLRLGC